MLRRKTRRITRVDAGATCWAVDEREGNVVRWT
jgi:hypothetical protein